MDWPTALVLLGVAGIILAAAIYFRRQGVSQAPSTPVALVEENIREVDELELEGRTENSSLSSANRLAAATELRRRTLEELGIAENLSWREAEQRAVEELRGQRFADRVANLHRRQSGDQPGRPADENRGDRSTDLRPPVTRRAPSQPTPPSRRGHGEAASTRHERRMANADLQARLLRDRPSVADPAERTARAAGFGDRRANRSRDASYSTDLAIQAWYDEEYGGGTATTGPGGPADPAARNPGEDL